MRILAIAFGIALAAAGGVIAYRAAFLEARDTLLIADGGSQVRELPDMLRTGGGIALLVTGALIAFVSARRRPR